MDTLENSLSALDPHRRGTLLDWLGEGEVRIRCPDGEVRETRLPGIWLDGDAIVVAPFPRSVLAVVETVEAPPSAGLPAEAGNAAAVLEEIRAASLAFRSSKDGAEPVMPSRIDLSRLPLIRSDIDLLEQALGFAGVEILVDCEGETHFAATRLPGIWWGRYHEPEGRETLVTIEVGEVPELVLASPEDVAVAQIELRRWLAGEVASDA